MLTSHFEFLVEEPSMEAFLKSWLPRHIPTSSSFHIHVFQGKIDLMGNLRARLKAYSKWLPDDWRIIIIVDRDDDDCETLKGKLESFCEDSRLTTRKVKPGGDWSASTCLAIEELEAWYFGEWTAVRSAYPAVSSRIPANARYRNPDYIRGGTWEAFERVMKRSGYFSGGLEKVRAAREIGAQIVAARSMSHSFCHLVDALTEANK